MMQRRALRAGNGVRRALQVRPDPNDLRDTAEESYAEVGDIAMPRVKAKIKRVRKKLLNHPAATVVRVAAAAA